MGWKKGAGANSRPYPIFSVYLLLLLTTTRQSLHFPEVCGKPCSDLYSRGIKSQNVTTRLFYFFFTRLFSLSIWRVWRVCWWKARDRSRQTKPSSFMTFLQLIRAIPAAAVEEHTHMFVRCLTALGRKYKHVAPLILIDHTRWWTRLQKARRPHSIIWMFLIRRRLVNPPPPQTSEINDARPLRRRERRNVNTLVCLGIKYYFI